MPETPPQTATPTTRTTERAIVARRQARELHAGDLITTTTITDEAQHLTIDSLLDYSTPRGALETLHLEEVFGHADTLQTMLDPRDVVRPLAHGFFDIDDASGKAMLSFEQPDGGLSDGLLMTHTAQRQLANRIGGGGWHSAMTKLAEFGDWVEHPNPDIGLVHTGRAQATTCWNHMLTGSVKPSYSRTINVPGQGTRCLRSVHGNQYFAFDSVDLLQVLMEHAYLQGLPVAQCKVTDDSTLVTILLDPECTLRFQDGGHVMLNEPVPMLRAKTNSVGEGAVMLWGGLFDGFCTNALPTWKPDLTFSWAHRGANLADRIVAQLTDAVDSVGVDCGGTLEGYKRAQDVAVLDAAFMLQQWARPSNITRAQRGAVMGALADPASSNTPQLTTADGGRQVPRTSLARVVDAVTYAAQAEATIDGQNRLEMAAANLMSRGLEFSRSTGVIDMVPAA